MCIRDRYTVAIFPIKPSPVSATLEPVMPELGASVMLVASTRVGGKDSPADAIINSTSEVNRILIKLGKASRLRCPDKVS